MLKKALKPLLFVVAAVGALVVCYVLYTVAIALVAIGVMSSGPSIEEYYPRIEAAYTFFREDAELLYASVIPYASEETANLTRFSAESPNKNWPPEVNESVNAFMTKYETYFDGITSWAISLWIAEDGRWMLTISIPNTSGYGTCLDYYPYDALPRVQSQRLEGMAYGWSFAADRLP